MIEIYIAGITVGLFSIFNNIKNRKRSIQNSLLITILVLWVIRFSLFYLKSTSFLEAFPGIILIDQNLLFLDSVLLYLYTQSTYNTNFEWEKKLLHFIPFFIACALSLYIYLNIDLSIVYKSAENQIELDTFKPSFEEFLFIIFIILHNLVYLILSRVNLIRYNKKILDSYSSINNLQLKWLTKVIVIWVFLLVVPLIIYFISYLSSDMALEVMSDIFSICLLLSILIFSYFGINQEYAFQYNTTTIKKVNQKNEVLADKNTLQLKNDFKELSNFMSKEKPF